MAESARKLTGIYLASILLFSVLLLPIAVAPAAAAGNTLTVVGNQAYTFTGINTINTAGNTQVLSVGLEHVGGPGTSANVTHDVFWTNDTKKQLLNVQVVRVGVADDTRYNLSLDGFDHTSEFKIRITAKNYTPRLAFGAGNVSDRKGWYAEKNPNGTLTVTIFARPIETDAYFHPENGTTPDDSWFDGTKQANNHTAATVQLALDSLEGFDAAEAELFLGTVIEADAQSLLLPTYVPPALGGPRIDYDVNSPHLEVDGSVNDGFYELFVPEALLNDWGNPDIGNLTANCTCGNVDFTAVDLVNASSPPRLGIYGRVDFHYSSGTMSVGTQAGVGGDTTPPFADAGADQTVTVGEPVTLDGSGSTDDVGIGQYRWDVDVDGDFEIDTASSTASHTFSATGTFVVTLEVVDTSGNTDTDFITISVKAKPRQSSGTGFKPANKPPTSPAATATATAEPTTTATASPTATPPVPPTAAPTPIASPSPTAEPTETATAAPTASPTTTATESPTATAAAAASPAPTQAPGLDGFGPAITVLALLVLVGLVSARARRRP